MRMLIPVAAVLLLSAEDCKTTKPTSDSSPPSLQWVVTNKTEGPAFNTQMTIDGTGTIPAKRGDSYQVTLKAIDPQGIKRIELGGSGDYGCSSGNIGQNVTIDQTTDHQDLTPNAQNEVLTQIVLLRNVELSGWNCQSGFTFSGGSLQLRGKGNNYFSGETKGTLTFSVSP